MYARFLFWTVGDAGPYRGVIKRLHMALIICICRGAIRGDALFYPCIKIHKCGEIVKKL